uniref:hypothetical protein n=1 Tax=Pleurocordyceps sinensis TaxID=99896 RepID=UPI00220D6ABA|nr:hypothetical protein OOD12_mgp18 [Pleurocordyceps sinensis]UXR11749.1 hypothetical protein [Pleurocordyceps sinensis]
MIKNFKFYIKKSFFIFTKILIIFIIGFIIRSLLSEIWSIIFLNLYSLSGLYFFNDYINNKLFNDITYLKRPRNFIIDNDYQLKDKFRRKCHWIFLEQYNSNYENYKDFKNKWKPDSKYLNLLKNKYSEKKYEIVLFKKTLLWFLNRKNGG